MRHATLKMGFGQRANSATLQQKCSAKKQIQASAILASRESEVKKNWIVQTLDEIPRKSIFDLEKIKYKHESLYILQVHS